ncbi:MAG: DNA polymerase III subunit gamma/tau [Pirellulales bacterium]|nr:DNA polymerase III subunit gamma/tau [Pirellulales bacterium]
MVDTPTSAVPEDTAHPGRYTVIARRYRPQAFDELVGQEHVARALQQAISSDRVGHAYLFTGARGVGKTSAARILAKALNCVHGPTPTPCNECDVCQRVTTGDDVDVLEIDGASNRGIDEIRQLRQNVAVRPSRVRYKIYIIDEVHMLTKEAFNALLKTLEEPPGHVKFIFATTEPQKIPITILSRCQRFDFAGISAASIQERLAQIAAAEGVTVEADALQILASRAAGSMRDSQSLLEQLLAIGSGRITAEDVNNLLGIAPAERLSGLVRHLANRDAPAALAELDSTVQSGAEVGLLLDQLVGYFRDVMAITVGCKPDQLLYALPSQAAEVAEVGRQLGIATVLAIGQILDHTSARMRVSMHGRTLVEMAIVRICQLGELDDLATLVAELRGTTESTPQRVAGVERQRAPSAPPPTSPPAPDASKKNADPPAIPSLANGLANAVASALAGPPAQVPPAPPREVEVIPSAPPAMPATIEQTPSRVEPPRVREAASDPNERLAELTGSDADESPPAESVLAMFERAMAAGGAPRVDVPPPRKSRREQLAEIAEQPFVQRAMELFDVQPGQFKYQPPGGESN